MRSISNHLQLYSLWLTLLIMHHICSSNEEKVWALNNYFYYIWYIDDYRVNLPDMYTLCNKAINNIFFFYNLPTIKAIRPYNKSWKKRNYYCKDAMFTNIVCLHFRGKLQTNYHYLRKLIHINYHFTHLCLYW